MRQQREGKKGEHAKASFYSKEEEGHYTETERSGYWQPADTETERVITEGQLDTETGLGVQDTVPAGLTGRNMSRGRVCV